ncbi:hypothetical protein GCM10025862_11340 [Arsenicicoccus piscis]|uniref:B12-binding domain-containing protein n=1 Tax=Arsenicicoccus piscis TaxID=673954 RepID=A0ABQ6HM00_9MICO|nr:hypothetical protein GCM10025862_11340 [Arsenicicoccus piscis]
MSHGHRSAAAGGAGLSPFGPAGLPSLGLGLLTTLVRGAGHTCRTHYWNLEITTVLQGDSPSERLTAYRRLSQRNWFPLNEWVFAEALFGHRPADDTEVDVLNMLSTVDPGGSLERGLLDLLELRRRADELVERQADRLIGADVVGIGTTFYQNMAALALAKTVKARSPGTTVILGGANCDGEMGPALFDEFPFLDAVFVGEADDTIVPFLDSVLVGRPRPLPGVRQRGLPRDQVTSHAVADLDTVPSPDFSDWFDEQERYGVRAAATSVIALEASRGCWWGAVHHCTFCGLNALGIAHRSKSIDRVVAEVRDVVAASGARFVFMTDNILPMSLLSGVRDRLGGPDTEIFFEVKANLRADQVQRLVHLGVTAAQPGIESFSSPVLHHMNKGVSAATNVEFLRNAAEAGLRPAYNILYGFPNEDPAWYAPMIDQVPRLTHLVPPSGLAQVEYHRFSPYHSAADRYGLDLVPAPEYSRLYPWDQQRISRVAYLFVPRRPAARPAYATTLTEAVDRWRTDHAHASLSWRRVGADIVVDDRRATRRVLRLTGFLTTLHDALARPRSPSALADLARAEACAETRVEACVAEMDEGPATVPDGPPLTGRPGEQTLSCTAAQFMADPGAWLGALDAAGLVFRDDDGERTRYVRIAVAAGSPPATDHWESTGV